MRCSVSTVGKRGTDNIPFLFLSLTADPVMPFSFLLLLFSRGSQDLTVSFSSQQWCFESEWSDTAKVLARPFKQFFTPFAFSATVFFFSSLTFKQFFMNVLWEGFFGCCDWVCYYCARHICLVCEQACEKTLSHSIFPNSSTSAGMLTFLPTSQCGILI